MKKARIIIGLIFLAVTLTINICVCNAWYNQGCEFKSLLLAVAFYTIMIGGIWAFIDCSIKERQNN